MTDEEINESITEATGLWDHPYSSETKVMMDFCSDLNAMHEAEKMLLTHTKERGPYPFTWKKYLSELFQCVLRHQEKYQPQRMIEMIVPKWIPHATARQRAEAFLRTLGRWRE